MMRKTEVKEVKITSTNSKQYSQYGRNDIEIGMEKNVSMHQSNFRLPQILPSQTEFHLTPS